MKNKHIFSLFLWAGAMLSCAKEIAPCEENNEVLREGYRWLEVSLAMENPKTIIAGAGSATLQSLRAFGGFIMLVR